MSGRLSRVDVGCFQVNVSERRRALRSAVESFRVTCVHCRSRCSSSCCSDLNATTVVYFVSLKLQERKKERKKERRFCPQCGELCRSVMSSDINISFGIQTG